MKTLMKSRIALAAALVVTALSLNASVRADDTTPPPRTLNQIMKSMGAAVFELSRIQEEAPVNPALITLTQSLIKDIEEGKGVIPTKVKNLPEPQLTEQTKKYQDLMTQLANRARAVEQELKNDNAAAAKKIVVEDFTALKRLGHTAFK